MTWSTRIPFSLVLYFALTSLVLGHAQSRNCKPVPLTTETRWGGNERIEIDLRDKPVRKVEGNVLGPGEGTLSTLVQVFLRQPSDPLYQPPSQERRMPVAACVTGTDGSFDFSLPPGEYELLMSQNVGVDVTSVLITVRHGHYRSEKISVVMHVGT
jgi:hypothetical protein